MASTGNVEGVSGWGVVVVADGDPYITHPYQGRNQKGDASAHRISAVTVSAASRSIPSMAWE